MHDDSRPVVADRRAPTLRTRLWVCAGAVLLGLVLAEVVARVLDLRAPPPFEREGPGLFQQSADPLLRFENRPGGEQRLLYREHHDSEPRVVEMRVNEAGFRGALPSQPKPPGVVRVACIGDSHTFGWGVDEDETWPAYLAEELARRYPERRFEVLNCGVNNYDTRQEVVWLQQRVLAFEPDLVLLQFYVNDAAVRGTAPLERAMPDRWMIWTTPGRVKWLDAIRKHSHFVDAVCDGVYRRRGLRHYAAERAALFGEDEPGWTIVRESLREARDVLAARDIPFNVALYPFLVREGAHLTSHAPFRIVQEFLEAEAIVCIDTEPAFLGADVDTLRVSPHDYHGNAAANRIFAAAIAEALEHSQALVNGASR